jgi:SAM-dependent methyltransferase
MDMQQRHRMLVRGTHDELARQHLVNDLRVCLFDDVAPGNQAVYERRVAPRLRRELKRDPKDRHDVRRGMTPDPYYRLYCASLRASQEMMWDSVIDSVERELALTAEAIARGNYRGTLATNPKLKIPAYHTAADIHLQPGGYHSALDDEDLSAGALYDRAVYLYARGGMGPWNDDLGQAVAAYVKKRFPKLAPKRILDMGCSVGHSTLAWKAAFAEADVHGIDLGSAMVRYAHARAGALGEIVHFSQQNAEKTNFPKGHFDLIVSHLFLHETSTSALVNILRESHRVLAPGGVMVHQDLPLDRGMKPFDSFRMDWEAYNNNETFVVALRDMDLVQLCRDQGFRRAFIAFAATPTALRDLAEGRRPRYGARIPVLTAVK